MGEIEVREVVFLHDARAQHVHGREHPATTGTFLVGDAFHVYPVFEIVVNLALNFPVEGVRADVLIVCQHVLNGFGGSVFLEAPLDVVQFFFPDRLGA